MMKQAQIGRRVETVARLQKIQTNQGVFDFLVAELGQFNLSILFIHHVITSGLDIWLTKNPRSIVECLFFQLGRNLIDRLVQRCVFLGGPGNNQRRTRLINQYRVDFVNDGEKELALKPVLGGKSHIGAQIVEPEFVVGAVNDIGLIGLHFFCGRLTGLYDPDPQPKRFVYRCHPLRVSLGEVIVYRYHVDTLAGQGVQIGWQRGHQGFAFASPHLGDPPLVKRNATNQLDVEVPHVLGALCCFPHRRERFRQQLVQGLASSQARSERLRVSCQIGLCVKLGLEVVDALHQPSHAFQFASIFRAK